MTVFLTILVLVSIMVAIWQLVKIFDLANADSTDSPVATDKDNRVNGYLMMGFLAYFRNRPFRPHPTGSIQQNGKPS